MKYGRGWFGVDAHHEVEIAKLRDQLLAAEREIARLTQLNEGSFRAIELAGERIASCEERTAAAEDRSVRILAEARLMMTEAMALSRTAASAIFGDGKSLEEVERPMSIAQADRAEAIRRREESVKQREEALSAR